MYLAPKLIQSMTKACLIKQMSTALETSYNVYLGLVLSNCVQWCTAYTFYTIKACKKRYFEYAFLTYIKAATNQLHVVLHNNLESYIAQKIH